MVTLGVARAMDLFVFCTGPGRSPAFFAAITAAVLAAVLSAPLVRRLRDAGVTRRAILLVLVPILGWIALCHLLLSPTVPAARSPVP